MLKLTLWFDKFDTAQEQEKQLENILKNNSPKAISSIVSIKYTPKIGKLIKTHNIESFSFENLDINKDILYNGKIYKIKYIRHVNPNYIRITNELGKEEHIKIGEFKIYE